MYFRFELCFMCFNFRYVIFRSDVYNYNFVLFTVLMFRSDAIVLIWCSLFVLTFGIYKYKINWNNYNYNLRDHKIKL